MHIIVALPPSVSTPPTDLISLVRLLMLLLQDYSGVTIVISVLHLSALVACPKQKSGS